MTKLDKNKKVIDIFKDNYKNLFKAEKIVADYIINNPNKVTLMSVKEIANETKVSDATVVRMCQHSGFDGFYQMKILLLRDIGEGNQNDIADFQDKPIEFFLNRKKSLINTINKEDNINNIKKLVSKLLDSNITLIAATGNTLPVALDLEFRLNRLGIKTFTTSTNERLLNYTSNLNENDFLITISKSGLSKNILKVSDIANNKNIKQACITSEINSSLSENSDITIFSGKLYNDINNSYNGLESHIGEFIINDIIIAFVASTKHNKNQLLQSQQLEYEFFSSLKL